MARAHTEIHEKDILGVLQAARHPLSVREMASKLDAHGHARQELKKLIKRLRHSGRVAEVRGGRYLLAVALAGIFSVPLAIAGYFALPPTYSSVGIVRIHPTLPKIMYTNDENTVPPLFDSFVSAQSQFLSSRR